MEPGAIFDLRAVRRHRDRAAGMAERPGEAGDGVADLLGEATDRLLDRLNDTTTRFGLALDLGGRGLVAPALAARGIETVSCDLSARFAARERRAVVGEPEFLPFGPASFDLVVASLCLHWANDLPGALLLLRRSLRPGGLFLASLPVLDTLADLRLALAEAEDALTGRVAPRISPFPTLRDCAALLQRAGFASPVADGQDFIVAYRDPMRLLRDLRAGGETNATMARSRIIPPRALFPQALARLKPVSGRMEARVRLAILTGWAGPP